MPTINPSVLVWARETAGLSVAAAAKSLALGGKKTPGDEILARYEAGECEVSRPVLNKMASVYRRPLLAFYLPEPPKTAPRGEDFRMLPPEQRIENKGMVDAVVRDIYVRQDLIKSLLFEIEEAEPKDFVGSLHKDASIKDAVGLIVRTINFDLAKYRRFRKNEEAFAYLRGLVESVGIFVLLIGNLGSHHTNLPVESFRGFALADKVAPVIVVNDQDAPAARSFTILHELTHILMGLSGISGARSEHAIERFCNDVASQVLLANDELNGFQWSLDNREALLSEVAAFGRRVNVSGSLVAYRLLITGQISESDWNYLAAQLRRLWIAQKALDKEGKDDGTGPSYYVVRRHKVGSALVGLVQRTLLDGAITATKAGRVLGVKPANVYNLVGI